MRQPSRRKIEYIPLAPEPQTYGGRDLEKIQNEWHRMTARPLKHSDEFGHVDIDALTLSLRSRISTELSYSLTTFGLLTLVRPQPQNRDREVGFPVYQAPELLDEAVDLMEDFAFDGVEDDGDLDVDAPLITHKELVNSIVEDETKPFAALESKPGGKDPKHGPGTRPANVVLMVIFIIRSIAQGDDQSATYLAKHPKLLHVLMRLCSLAPHKTSATPAPLSPILSMTDLLTIRKEAIHLLISFGWSIDLSSDSLLPKTTQLTVRRAYELMASFLVDPSEAVTPFQYILQTGMNAQHPKPPSPPSLANHALEAFARFTLPDDNRRAVAQCVPHAWVWTLFEALVHRLPVTDHDFQAILRESWIAYLERLVLALYSLAFLAPPALKERAKRDGALGFSKVVLRLLRKLLLGMPPESRTTFAGLLRRAIELLKVVDDAADAFDAVGAGGGGSAGAAAGPTLAFGVGYGEHGDARVERGLGMLCAYQEDVTFGLMMHSDVVDQMLFQELESLVRVGP